VKEAKDGQGQAEAPPQAILEGEPGEETGPGEPEPVPYRKLFRWGWYVICAALGWFLVNTLLTIILQLLGQYNVQVLATVVSGLSRVLPGGEAGAGRGGPAADEPLGGFLAALLPQDLHTAAALFAVLALCLIFLRFLERLLTTWTDNLMVARLQQRLHDKLLTLGPSYHQAHDLGETMLIVTRFSSGSQMLLRDLISFPVVRGLGLITAMVFLANNLTAVGDTPGWVQGTLLATIFLLPLGGWWLSLRLRQAYEKVRDAEAALANEFSNSAELPLEVQLMGAGPQRSRAFAARLATLIRHKLTAAVQNEIATQFHTSTPVFLQTVFLIYGVFFALHSPNPAAPGAILAIYYFVPQAVRPLQEIIQFFAGLQSTWPQVEKVVEILEAEPEVRDRPGAVPLTPREGALVVENLTFSYTPDGDKILDCLSYAFAPGKVTAIVARAGMGKSTLLNLIARLRDPQEGRILIDGQDIREVTLDSLRRQVVKVSQFPLFVADTIRANLKLAAAEATDAELEEVCRRTGLWQVLEHAVGPRGHPLEYHLPRAGSEGLSGGQRRLLAVTRALLHRPVILLLDEPTTGIDAIGRAQVAAVLRQACQGLTVLLVDHDVEFLTHFADWICCLENGRFIAEGTPADLAHRPGLFRDLLEASREAPAPAPEGTGGPP
jgi:ATP-binding cassette subfamily B protein